MATISSLGVGSGLDLSGLLNQLESAERQKLTPITTQKKSYQAEISAYGKLESALSSFQTAVSSLNKATLYQSVTSSVEGSSVTATSTSDAVTGSYTINVTNVAKASSMATDGIADKTTDLGAGTVSFTFGDGSTLDVDITAGDSSLEAIRDAINAKEGGVSASIVNDGSGTPYRLSLASTETGTDAGISSVTFSGDLGGQLAIDAATEVVAEDATLTVNGISITSQSNRIEEAIQGVTLDIVEEGESTLTVERDTESIKDAIESFVKSYNSLRSTMDSLSSYDSESGNAGELLGDSTLRSVESRLRSTLSDAVEGGEFSLLSDLGISLQLNGKLKIDDDKLDDAIANNLSGVSEFFAGSSEEGGMAGQLDGTLESMLEDNGLLDNRVSGLETSVENLNDRFALMERNIEATIDRYRQQFTKLDGLIASMNQTSTYLTQQFESLNAQLGRN
ncbi:flagellar hook-associated protein 2 [Litchfieldella qijiaojingensis]|uniref:Flagellar hook-associated protein 2 n=1 Tax=Litchfieldella qijiaojingensis TaxID=980347 RepID=A0ABQ2YCT8_9GAMM|nr:flagellar filament capping protein FliD [Halomonas qijiaojingensis]GGX80153.1 flagellar hook-associated protein 2 [Halomonas qijiaojingensis]